jgi:hypothetical protein
VSTVPSPEAASSAGTRRDVERCVEQLSADFRDTLVRRKMEDFFYEAIAEIAVCLGEQCNFDLIRLQGLRESMTEFANLLRAQ